MARTTAQTTQLHGPRRDRWLGNDNIDDEAALAGPAGSLAGRGLLPDFKRVRPQRRPLPRLAQTTTVQAAASHGSIVALGGSWDGALNSPARLKIARAGEALRWNGSDALRCSVGVVCPRLSVHDWPENASAHESRRKLEPLIHPLYYSGDPRRQEGDSCRVSSGGRGTRFRL